MATFAHARQPAQDPGTETVLRLRALLPQALRTQVRSARELGRQAAEEELGLRSAPLPTAIPAFDRLLGGGLPRGQLVELAGALSSGRFSVCLAALAAATGAGEAAALVDLGDGLDPALAEAMGVDLSRLLWLRPRSLKQALGAAEMVAGSGFPLVVLELGNPPLRGGRGLEAAWLRLARAARAQGSALLVATPYRISGTAATVVLAGRRAHTRWLGRRGSTPLLGGSDCRISIEKHRGQLPGAAAPLGLRLREAVETAPPSGPSHRSTPSPLSRRGLQTARELHVLPLPAGTGMASGARNPGISSDAASGAFRETPSSAFRETASVRMASG